MTITRYTIITISLVLLSSCSSISDGMSWGGLILLGLILMGIFIFMFYLIIKRKKQGQKSLTQFSLSIQSMLEKFEHPKSRIGALNALIDRIMKDEQYQKDTTWRDQVLAKTYLHLATEYHQVGDMKNTLIICSKILELTPDDAMTLYNRGSMYLNSGEYDKALNDLNRSIELVDNYASSYNNRGTIYNKLGKYDDAIADFNKALELEESPIIYYNKANTLRDLQRIKDALVSYNKAIELIEEDNEELRSEISQIIESLSTENE